MTFRFDYGSVWFAVALIPSLFLASGHARSHILKTLNARLAH
jgi:hypothetical protein